MSGFFGCVSRLECVNDVFYGTDYQEQANCKKHTLATSGEFSKALSQMDSLKEC